MHRMQQAAAKIMKTSVRQKLPAAWPVPFSARYLRQAGKVMPIAFDAGRQHCPAMPACNRAALSTPCRFMSMGPIVASQKSLGMANALTSFAAILYIVLFTSLAVAMSCTSRGSTERGRACSCHCNYADRKKATSMLCANSCVARDFARCGRWQTP